MAFVVEDGTGKADANSYVSVADADAYAADHELPSKWSSATTAQKQKALRLATQNLDARYNGRWLGTRNIRLQALDWPRFNVEDSDGYLVDFNVVPQAVKDATVELALRQVQLASGTLLIPDQSSPGTIASESVSIGEISESITYVGGRGQQTDYVLVDLLVRDLVSGASQTLRG